MADGNLSALKVSKLKKVGRHADGDGLYLQVARGGSKSWIFRYRPRIKKEGDPPNPSREMGLGSVKCEGKVGGTFTLAEAREQARKQRQLLQEGVDPIAHRQMARAAAGETLSFKDCARQFIKAKRSGWKNAKHADQWTATLEKWAYPLIGDMSVALIGTDHVMKVLQQDVDGTTFWEARTETASRVRGRIDAVLGWATVKRQRAGDNPARWTGHIEHLLPKKSQVAPVEHHAAMRYQELPRFMVELRARDSSSARALEFTILTACRTSDTTGATKAEVDLKEKLWTVPAARLKGQKGRRERDHVVPLSEDAFALLGDLKGEGDYLFPGGRDGYPLSNAAMDQLLKGMGYAGDVATVHGFRSSFKDWCAEQTDFPNEMSELALAHTVSDKVEAAYRRGNMREKRRRMMEDWAAYCAGQAIAGNVVPIRA